jgi:hypothetical protein
VTLALRLLEKIRAAPSTPKPSAHRRTLALLADFFSDFFAAFLETVFLADFCIDDFAVADFLALDFLTASFLAADFLGAGFLVTAVLAAGFVGGVFLAATLFGVCFTGAFFAPGCATALSAILVAAFEDSSCGDFVTDSIAAPTADLIDPAISSAIASPYPTFSAAFCMIVFSAIHCLLVSIRTSLRIVETCPSSASKCFTKRACGVLNQVAVPPRR